MLNDVEQKRMRIDPETCRDPDLLAAEVRRLQGVIAAGEATLTDEEREAVERAVGFCECTTSPLPTSSQIATIRGLLDRTK